MSKFKFEIIRKSKKSNARVGRIHTPHGIIDTPNFVAVGTNGTIKALDNNLLNEMNLQLMFCNTYHLLLRPGTDVIEKAKGIHKFSKRKGPIITDSGGFQVFSLAYGSVYEEMKKKVQKKEKSLVIKISEEGVLFRSYIDGKKILLTPETSIQAQKAINSDIIIPLDELPPYHTDKKKLIESLDRTHRWEKRSLNEHLKNKKKQAIYAVVHGGIDNELRKKSATYLSSLGFDGFAIGGSVGKNKKEMLSMLKNVMKYIPSSAPNHLLGIGDIESINLSIPLGIDAFDSSYPTKAARHGLLLRGILQNKKSFLKISNLKNKNNFGPIDKNCNCRTCQNYSISFLHHLYKAKELSFYTLATIHNINFMIKMMENIREKIMMDAL